MGITLYRCPEDNCDFTARTWKPFLKHQREVHNSRYDPKTETWTRMNKLELFLAK